MEFVLLVSFMLLIFFSFFLSFQNKIVEIARAQDMQYLQEANDVVISEIELAQKMYADYERTFILPSIADKPYQMNLTDLNEITSYYNGLEYVNFLQVNISGDMFAGDLENGENTIYRTDGVVYLPDGTVYRNDAYAGFYANVNPETCYSYNYSGNCEDLYDINSQFKQFCVSFFDLVCPVCPDGVVDEPYEDCDNNEAGNHDCWPGGVLNTSDPLCIPDVPNPYSSDDTFITICNTDCTGETVRRGCNDDGGWCDQQDVNMCPGNGDANPNNNDCDGMLNMSLSENEFNFSDNFNAEIVAQGCSAGCNYQIIDTQIYNLGTSSWESIGPNWPWNMGASIDPSNKLQITALGDDFLNTCDLGYVDANVTIIVSDDIHPIDRTETFTFKLFECPGCGDGELQVFGTYSESCDYGEFTDDGSPGTNDPTSCDPGYGPSTYGGALSSCQYCASNCQWETNVTTSFCGNGLVEPSHWEECDNSSGLPEPSPWSVNPKIFCNVDCENETAPYCGDMIVNGEETCDFGGTNNNDTGCVPAWGNSCTYCNSVCQEITVDGSGCGDTHCDLGFETCYSCPTDCNSPPCASSASLSFYSDNQNEGIILSYRIGEGLSSVDLDWRSGDASTSIAYINAPFSELISNADYDNLVDHSTFNNDGSLGAGSSSYAPLLGGDFCRENLGSCYVFESDNIIEFDPQEDVRNDFSFSFWARPTSSFSSLPNVGTPTSTNQFVLFPENQGTNIGTGVALGDNGVYVIGNLGGANYVLAGGSGDFSDWNFFTVVFSDDTPRIFVNGNSFGTNSINSITYFPPRIIGSSSFTGGFDEFMLFDRVLSDSDVFYLYDSYLNRADTSPKARFQKLVPGENWRVKLTGYGVDGIAIPPLYSNSLYIPGCGDGSVDTGEECDDGFPNPESEVCQTNSNNNRCNFDSPDEDFYEVFRSDYTYCTTDCELGTYRADYYCGDEIVQSSLGENCDYGQYNGGNYCDVLGTTPEYGDECYTCSIFCHLSSDPVNEACGDGNIDSGEGELCDTGLASDGCCNSGVVAKIGGTYYPGCDEVSDNVICDSSIDGTDFVQDGLCVCDSSTCSSNSDSDVCFTQGSGNFVCRHDGDYYSNNSGVCSFGDRCDDILNDETFDYEYSGARHYVVSLRIACDSDSNDNTCVDYSSDNSIFNCCTDDTTDSVVEKCVTPDGVCVNGFSSDRAIISLGGEQVYCYQGNWYDVDNHQTSCEEATGGNAWTKAGADNLGEYVNRISFECCGDDSDENVVSLSCDSDLTCGSSGTVCCSSDTDCYLNSNTCSPSGYSTEDINSDGNDDYCLSGTWYDCETDADCSTGLVCDTNYDCVLAPDGHPCTLDSTCASGYCDNDGVGISDDGHCYTPSAGNENCDGGNCFDGEDYSCEYDTGYADALADERIPSWQRDNTASTSNYFGCPARSSCLIETSPACQAYDGDYNSVICGIVGGTWTSIAGGVDSTDCSYGVSCGDGNDSYCCGDDHSESGGVLTEISHSRSVDFVDDDFACCAYANCVAGSNCYSSQSAGTTYSGLNELGNDNYAHCYNYNGVGEWLDCDQSDYMDYWCGNICGPKKGVKSPRDVGYPDSSWNAVLTGETSDHGEYSGGSSTLGCCGDDYGEYYKTRTCDSTNVEGCSGSSTDAACCNTSTDCIADGICYTHYPDSADPTTTSYDFGTEKAVCISGVWNDADGHENRCIEINSRSGWFATWTVAGEVFGEYEDTETYECCGDDDSEFSRSRVCSAKARCTSNSDDVACCNRRFDCVMNGVCYSGGETYFGDECFKGSWIPELVLFCDDDGKCEPTDETNSNCGDCFCGDGYCYLGTETSSNCPSDCGSIPICGDGFCDTGELKTCPEDCFIMKDCNQDGHCDFGEDLTCCDCNGERCGFVQV